MEPDNSPLQMSRDTVETFKAIREANKQVRAEERREQYDALIYLEDSGYTVEVVNGNEHTGDIFHVRVNGKLDLHLTNKRFHDLRTKERGHYDDPILFVTEQLK